MDLLILFQATLLSIFITTSDSLIEERSRICHPSNPVHCYSLYRDPNNRLSWYEADSCCKGQGRSLISVPDPATQGLAGELVENADIGSEGVWISGQSSNDSVWKTLDGKIYPGTVDGGLELYNNGGLKKIAGTIQILADSYRYLKYPLCQIPTQGDCSVSVGGICYKLLSVRVVWYKAVRMCEQYTPGASLAYTNIHTDQFSTAIATSSSIPDGTDMWLGVYKRPWFWNRLNEYKEDWVMSYFNWGPGGGSQASIVNPQCALLQKRETSYAWYSSSCNSGNNNFRYSSFICEHDPVVQITKTDNLRRCKVIPLTTTTTTTTVTTPTTTTVGIRAINAQDSSTQTSAEGSSGLAKMYIIVIAVVVSLVIVAVIIVATVLLLKRRRRNKKYEEAIALKKMQISQEKKRLHTNGNGVDYSSNEQVQGFTNLDMDIE